MKRRWDDYFIVPFVKQGWKFTMY